MFAYILRRLLYMPFILLGVIFITFVLFQITSTPESQAKLHIGEKASARQTYDWLANKGLITWTDSGETKLKLVSDSELPPKMAHFVSTRTVEDLPGEIDSLKEEIEDAGADLADLETSLGVAAEDTDVPESVSKARARKGVLENKLVTLNQQHDAAVEGARIEFAYLKVGKADYNAAQDLRRKRASVEVLDKRLAKAKDAGDSAEIIAEIETDLNTAKGQLVALEKSNDRAEKALTAAEAEAAGQIQTVGDIEPDFEYTGFFTNFAIYLLDIIRLDFGDTRTSRPVMSVIYNGMWPSLALTIPAFFLAELIGVFFGLFAAMYRQTKIDTSIVVSAILLMSINGIALIMFGQKFLAADLNYFPVTGYANGLGAARFLALPIILYIVITFGERIRFNRIVMLDETNQDYVRTARAKGLGGNSVLFKHVFRNTLIPLITRWAVAIPSLYLGSLVLESFFSIPGLGFLTVDAIQNSDANVVRAVVVFGSISFMIANLVSDILYAVADPRVKLS